MLPDLDSSFLFLSFLGLSRFCRDSPDLSGDFRDLLFSSFLGLFNTAPLRNSPERVRDTIRTFPEISGNRTFWKPLVQLLPKS